jgi:hypothetical protein
VLSLRTYYSNWEAVSLCASESFEALSEGLQGALWGLGAVPLEHRTDNLSAATHDLRTSRGRGFTARYRELLDHYGLRGSKNTPGRAHENGDVESAHGGFKGAVEQRLRLWGSRDFESLEAYWAFLDGLLAERIEEVLKPEAAPSTPLVLITQRKPLSKAVSHRSPGPQDGAQAGRSRSPGAPLGQAE